VIVAWFEPVPIRPEPETIAVIDSDAEAPAVFFCVTAITATASEAVAFGANTSTSAVAEIVSPLLRIEVDVPAEAFVSGAVTVTVHTTAAELTPPVEPVPREGVNL